MPLSPEQQKQQTLHALLTILLRIAAQQPVLFVMEDLHWVDPSTLELLSLLVDQGPTARILALFTFRPDFTPPWTGRSHFTQVTVHRLPRPQAVEVIRQVAHGKALPPEVVEQIVAKTDGVPLFVEELTKMVLESGLLQEREDHYELTGPLPPLAIPATLHDSLMARLDRLATVKGLAQLGATLGREFSYALLQAVCAMGRGDLATGAAAVGGGGVPVPAGAAAAGHVPLQACPDPGHGLSVLAAEHPPAVPSAHCPGVGGAVSRDLRDPARAAGASLHRGGCPGEQAIPYWQRAGQRAIERSAYVEAVSHLRGDWSCSQPCRRLPERLQQELDLQIDPGARVNGYEGPGAPDMERRYTRARAVCQQVGETPQLFLRALWGCGGILSCGRSYRVPGAGATAPCPGSAPAWTPPVPWWPITR